MPVPIAALTISKGNSFWDYRYASQNYGYGTAPTAFVAAPNAFVAAMAAQIPVGPVRCLAEGEGRNAVFFAQLGHPVTTVHQSSVGLGKAARLAAERGAPLTTVVADLADDAIEPHAWAGIIATFAHLPPKLRRTAHARVVAGLRPGRRFILEAYTPAQLAHGAGGPKDVERLMTLAALRAELTGREFLYAGECAREVIEGTGHTGRGAVVQVCARKPDGAE